MLVAYTDESDRSNHRALFTEYRNLGTPGSYKSTKLERLLDTVYFAPSHPSRLLQAADMLAFTYSRWHTHTESNPQARALMSRLKSKILGSGRTNSTGNWP